MFSLSASCVFFGDLSRFFLLLNIYFILTKTQTERARALPSIHFLSYLFHFYFYFYVFYFYFYFNFQAQPIPSELTAKLLGNRVAVSPIVTIEPRRRKFHKPITLTIPVPVAASKGMINQYNGDTPTLRLLCSITGRSRLSQWHRWLYSATVCSLLHSRSSSDNINEISMILISYLFKVYFGTPSLSPLLNIEFISCSSDFSTSWSK